MLWKKKNTNSDFYIFTHIEIIFHWFEEIPDDLIDRFLRDSKFSILRKYKVLAFLFEQSSRKRNYLIEFSLNKFSRKHFQSRVKLSPTTRSLDSQQDLPSLLIRPADQCKSVKLRSSSSRWIDRSIRGAASMIVQPFRSCRPRCSTHTRKKKERESSEQQ